MSKQRGDYPKYVSLRPELIIKRQQILAALHEAGYSAKSLSVMSGFRKPCYDKAIGNVSASRHQWGDAADIFVDANSRDGMMDGLNRDGAIDRPDAVWLADFIGEMSLSGQFDTLVGLVIYGSNSRH